LGETLAQRESLKRTKNLAMSIPALFQGWAFWLFWRARPDRGNQGRGPGDLIWDLVER